MRILGGIAFFGLMGQSETDTYRTPHVRPRVPATLPGPERQGRWRVPHMAILVLGLLAGCAADPEPDPAPATPAPAADTGDPASPATPAALSPDTTQPADERQDTPATVVGAEWTAGDTNEERPVTGVSVLRAMRTARHEQFDRIVLDFGPDPVPGYRIAYIDRPVRQCGSGHTVPLAGDGWLSITAEPAHAHTEEGQPTVSERERAPGLPVLLELKMICDYEAIVEVVAGVASPERYRAFVLPSPNRLVVDIRHRQ